MPNFYHASGETDPTKVTSTVGTGSTVQKLEDKAAEAILNLRPQAPSLGSTKNGKGKKKHIHRSDSEIWEAEVNALEEPTDSLEVWFAGCHCGKPHSHGFTSKHAV